MESFDAQKFKRTFTPVEAMGELSGHQWEDRIEEKRWDESQSVNGSQLTIYHRSGGERELLWEL